MENDFLIVGKKVLPDYYDKVIEAKELLESGAAKDVTDAVKKTGISRSTYYKYKDVVFLPRSGDSQRRAVISLSLIHEPGILGKVLNCMSESGANVFTINQNPPIQNRALVVICIVIDDLNCSMKDLLEKLSKLKGVEKCALLDME